MESVQDVTVTEIRRLKRSLWCTRGFTFTELIIVLGIVGVVFMLAQTWLVSQLPHWRLNGAARQVTSDLLGAKMKAVVERNRQRDYRSRHRFEGVRTTLRGLLHAD